ncbi:cytochrome P450, partial [Tanacetum coccineum]
ETAYIPHGKEILTVRVVETEDDIDSLSNSYQLDTSDDENDDDLLANNDKETQDDYENDDDSSEGNNEEDVNVGTHIEEKSTSAFDHKVKDKGNNIPIHDTLSSNVMFLINFVVFLGRRSSSVPIKCTRKKKYSSLKLINPIDGIRKLNGNKKIERCNKRILAKPSHSSNSDSNEISNTIHVGNQIRTPMGTSGGIVAVWDTDWFTLTKTIDGDGFLALHGSWRGLTDLPLGGKRFTRMNNLGSKHSKIDRFLVSDHITQKWPSSHVLALSREFSDHTPLLLLNSAPDFGPTPFKFYNSWIEHSDFPMLVHETWASPTLGPPTLAFKTKLKILKKNIKEWRVKVVQTETEALRDTRLKIDSIYNKAETSPLSSAEIDSRATLVKKLANLEHIKIKNLKQIAKIRWAMEGDEDTHFFMEL